MFGADRFTWLEKPGRALRTWRMCSSGCPAHISTSAPAQPASDPATAAANHAPDAVFDESVIPDGAALLAEACRSATRARIGHRCRGHRGSPTQPEDEVDALVALSAGFLLHGACSSGRPRIRTWYG
jgi:hippurate hydrolase